MMVNAQHTANEFATDTTERSEGAEARLPFPQAAALAIALSLALWAGIGYGLSYLF